MLYSLDAIMMGYNPTYQFNSFRFLLVILLIFITFLKNIDSGQLQFQGDLLKVKVRRDDDVAWHVAKYHTQRVCFLQFLSY